MVYPRVIGEVYFLLPRIRLISTEISVKFNSYFILLPQNSPHVKIHVGSRSAETQLP